MMEKNNFVKAVNKNVRSGARKANLVLNFIKGKKADIAIRDLDFTRKKVALDIKKTIKSAVANASNIDLAVTSSTPAVWEEPLEPFELDPQFDYENCPQTPRFDTDIGRVAEEYARRKSAAMEHGASVDLAGLF